MRVSCIVICLSTVLLRECIRIGSLAIAAASALRSFDCEGPPQVFKRPCRLRPTAAAAEIRRGCIYHHLNSLPRDKWFRSSSCRSNWRNATTGQSGLPDSGETRQHVGIVLVECVGIDQYRAGNWRIVTSQFCSSLYSIVRNHHGTRTDHGGSAGRWCRICRE